MIEFHKLPGKPPMGPPAGFKPAMADIGNILRKTLDIAYANESPNQRLDIYLPEESDGPFPTLCYIHGGGFAIGDKQDDHLTPYLRALDRGWAVAAIEYRLSGEAIFPAAVLDVRQAVRFLKANSATYCIDSDRLCAIGGSAGGNLAAILCMNIPNGAFPGEGLADSYHENAFVVAAVDQFGPANFKTMDAQARANGISVVEHDTPTSAESSYLGIPVGQAAQTLCAQADPATYATKDMAPLLIQHGSADRLIPFQQSEQLFAALVSKGLGELVTFTPIEGADHEDQLFFTEQNMTVVLDFLDKHVKGS